MQNTSKHYLYNLNEIPAAHHALFSAINTSIETAFTKFEKGDKSLTRSGGMYLVVIKSDLGNLELIELKQYTQDAPEGLHGWWIAAEAKNKWYSDPLPNLKRLKESIGL